MGELGMEKVWLRQAAYDTLPADADDDLYRQADLIVDGIRAALAKPSVDLDVETLERASYQCWLRRPRHRATGEELAAEYTRLRDAQSTPEDAYVDCGMDGCTFAVERGEGRTLAFHRSEEHPLRDAQSTPERPSTAAYQGTFASAKSLACRGSHVPPADRT